MQAREGEVKEEYDRIWGRSREMLTIEKWCDIGRNKKIQAEFLPIFSLNVIE